MGRDREGKRERRVRSDSEESDEEEDRRLRDRKQEKGRGKRARDDSNSDDASTESEDEGRGRRRRRSGDRSKDGGRRKKGKGDESSESDSEEEGDRRRKRRRSREGKKRSRRKGRGDSSEESASSESEEEKEDRRKKGSITRVSEEELREFLAKKAQKKALKLAKRLRQKAVSGYTNDSNPFGDTNLTETFVWRKKIEKDVLRGTLDPRDVTLKKEKERLESRMEEIEKVKKRREERLLEKAKHDEEMAMLARERARAEFQDWEKKEDEFHFQQSRVRSEIRLREGRAKPIDVLARNLNLSEDFDIEINEPYKIYKGLTVKEMEELKEDIKMHLDYDRNTPMHVQFWNAMMVVCNHEISEATRRDILDRARVRGEEPPPELLAEERGLHSAVNAEVEATLAAKSSEELGEMEERIQHQMESGGAKLVEYWESVLKKLKVYKAKARLREIHADLLRQHLEILQSAPAQQQQQQQLEGEEDAEGDAAGRPAAANVGAAAAAAGSFSPELMTEEEAAAEGLILDEAEEGKEGGGGRGGEVGGKAGGGSGSGGGGGGFSPELIHAYEGDNDDVVDPDADKAELEQKRLRAMELQQRRSVQRQGDGEAEATGAGGGSSSHTMQAAAAAASGGSEGKRGSGTDLSASERAAAMKMMGPADGDAILGAGSEVKLESQVYWWHDKFRPRKPKYFNRVHTGYEWNKYNQTHYDHDNPPPKIVQGYKFNIFYPDLIDRSKAPYYSVEKDGSNGETCLIRFHAGPPYEDIAFRIVNKEWEYSHKKGFKCTFDRGILHVYFNFKRYRYRR